MFIHGFGGNTTETWGQFPRILADEPRLNGWDIYAIGYASSLRVDIPNVWSADPSLETISLQFRSLLESPPFDVYRSIALIAHSMGGLVVQHALLHTDFAKRVGFVGLFGTPSNGIAKASLVSLLKRQLRDMSPDSRFVKSLRKMWKQRFSSPAFVLRVTVGTDDEFVSSDSALAPFPPSVHRAAPGNHTEVVKPKTSADTSVGIVLEMLGVGSAPTAVNSAMLAVERREYAEAITTLEPQRQSLDDEALIQLALALDATGRRADARRYLEERYQRGKASKDAIGVLAGRVKRRWLSERRAEDWERARSLYTEGLSKATRQPGGPVDNDQAMYHGINVLFLDVLRTPPRTKPANSIAALARDCEEYAANAQQSHWSAASLGDCALVLNDIEGALRYYSYAREQCQNSREVDSMYTQAHILGRHLHGPAVAAKIQTVFGFPT